MKSKGIDKGFIVGATLGVIIGFLVVLCVSAFFHPDFTAFTKPLFFGNEAVQISDADKKALERLFSNGSVISPQDLIEDLTSFYTFVVEILLVLIGLLGILGFTYIKFYSYEQAKSDAKQIVNERFAHPEFEKRINQTVNSSMTSARRLLGRLQAKDSDFASVAVALEMFESKNFNPERMEKLEQSIQAVAERLALMDDAETSNQTKLDL